MIWRKKCALTEIRLTLFSENNLSALSPVIKWVVTVPRAVRTTIAAANGQSGRAAHALATAAVGHGPVTVIVAVTGATPARTPAGRTVAGAAVGGRLNDSQSLSGRRRRRIRRSRKKLRSEYLLIMTFRFNSYGKYINTEPCDTAPEIFLSLTQMIRICAFQIGLKLVSNAIKRQISAYKQ